MLNTTDANKIQIIRDYLDHFCYGYINYRLIPGHDSVIFPEFSQLQSVLKGFSPLHRLLFSVLRQGHVADDKILRAALPADFLDALISVGLLIKDAHGDWRTPSLALVPIEGLFLLVSLPPFYRNAFTTKQPVYLGMESIWLTRVLPPRLGGRTVLDICAGSGIQGMIAACRGATKVVSLERDPVAVSVARFNAALNGFGSIVDVRSSDLYSALAPDERFDVVLSNPPFMPVVADVEYPICGSGGVDGMVLLRPIFEEMAAHMNEGGEGWLFCNVLGDQYSINLNKDVLPPIATRDGLRIRCHVTDKAPVQRYIDKTLLPNLRNTCPTLPVAEAKSRAAAWQATVKAELGADQIYGQVLHIRKLSGQGGVESIPVYDPVATDPLTATVSMAYAMA
jgi:methylase of polypeptide subunit release factors